MRGARGEARRRPATADAFTAAVAAHRAGRLDEALGLYDRAIAQGQRVPGALTNIGTILRKRKQVEAAVAAHRRALELSPDDPGILGNLGNALKDAGRYDEAIALKRRVIELRGATDAEAWHSLGIALRDAGLIEEAETAFARALALAPDDAEIRFNLALAQLHLERFAPGWANYETRWRLDRMRKRELGKPWWHGAPFEGRTLLLFAEQGFGDTLQFIRFVPQIKARGGTVLLECQPELSRLLRSAAGLDGLVVRDTPEAARALAAADLVCPLASLPGICAVDLAGLPGAPIPYLAPPPGLEARLEPLLARAGARLKVGIVWSGSVTFAANASRSAGLAPYLRLAEIPGVQLYGLQKGPPLAELKALGTDSLIIDASPWLDDFADTAALIRELDLVVMTDSAVAHLAGALGRPVWVMLMHQPDWRWLKDRADSPWYPTARLFRQRVPRDWAPVFAEVAGELARLAAARRPPEPAPPGDLLLPAAFAGADGRPRFTMPIPAGLRDDAGIRWLIRGERDQGGLEHGTRRFLDEHLEPGDLFVDVGAHWGIMSLHAASRWPGEARVLAVEAAPRNVAQLRRWVAHNRLEDRIEVVAAGLADRAGFATLAPQSTAGHHLTHLGPGRAGPGLRIPVTTLDRLLAARPALAARPVVLKVDVEGLEPEVIAGAERLLASGRLRALIFEKGRDYIPPAGRRRLRALAERLQAAGLELWRLPHETAGGPLLPLALDRSLCNVLALPKGFPRRPDYAAPFAPIPPPLVLPWQPGAAELVAETEARIAARTADVDRWAVPERGPAAAARAEAAAAALAGAASVLDLGAGAMLLRHRLAPGCRYVPVDLLRFAPDVALMDLERAPLAPLGRHDAAALLALLEYLHDPGRLLGELARITPRAALTYPPAAGPAAAGERRRRGIVNDLDIAGLEALCGRAGWRVAGRQALGDGLLLALERA